MKAIFLLLFIACLADQLLAQTVKGTIVKTGSNSVTIYGKPDQNLNAVVFDNINICFSFPDQGADNPSIVVSVNYAPSLLWITQGGFPDIINGRAYYTMVGNDNNSNTSVNWTAGTDNPIVEITFSGGQGSEIVQLDDLSPDGGPSFQSYWYVQAIGLSDITNYGQMFYGTGAVNNSRGSPSWVPAAEAVSLPVELLSFAARPFNATDALLHWTTASEINSSHFEVERGVDGKVWAKIATVAAAGISQSGLDYRLTDERVFDPSERHAADLYYRLRMVDLDERFEYSEVRQVRFESAGGMMVGELFPNPASRGHAAFQLPVYSEEGAAVRQTVYDVKGSVIGLFEMDLAAGEQLAGFDLEQLAAGVYHLKISAGGVNAIRRLVVQ